MFKMLKIVLKVLFKVIVAYFSWILKYSRHPEKYPIELRYKKVRELITYVINKWPCEIHAKNFENYLKLDKASLIICNHISATDSLFLFVLSEKPISIVAKIEAKKYPVVGRVIKCIDGQFIDRDDIKSQIGAFKKIKKHFEDNDLSYCIFIEGTRNKVKDGPLLDFHAGTLKPAFWGQTDIIPVAVYGSDRLLPKEAKLKKYPVIVSFGEPVKYESFKELTTTDLAPTLKENMQIMVDESRKEYYKNFSSLIIKDIS